MSEVSLDSDLALAIELADAADAITKARFRAHDLAIETKPDLTPVTEADRSTEEALTARIQRARPGDAVGGSWTRSTAPRTTCAAYRCGRR
jgi:histidinol-phosphatase